jgi:hypothetical protein
LIVTGLGEFDPCNAIDFGWDTFDEETQFKKRAIELNQGRAAQMGILPYGPRAIGPPSFPVIFCLECTKPSDEDLLF